MKRGLGGTAPPEPGGGGGAENPPGGGGGAANPPGGGPRSGIIPGGGWNAPTQQRTHHNEQQHTSTQNVLNAHANKCTIRVLPMAICILTAEEGLRGRNVLFSIDVRILCGLLKEFANSAIAT